jgi:site-specific recombinase XerD
MEINVILTESFEKWMKTLEYAPTTVYASVGYVRDFFFYLKSKGITSLEQVKPAVITGYHEHLQTRPYKNKPGALSQNYIANNINALKRFNRYLQVTGRGNLEINLQTPVDKSTSRAILTPAEIKALYKTCGSDYIGIRDRAILSIYYGCGLRKNEGAALDVTDILLKENRVYVRKGKNYKERYVPMTVAVREDLENYIYVAREKILSFKNIKPQALFLSRYVKRMCGNAVMERVHKLVKEAKIQKEAGLHTLRHSIATHLLQAGMTLEEVKQFLGHSSLESTQIYTHVSAEASAKEDLANA